jgi:hypothetical protein
VSIKPSVVGKLGLTFEGRRSLTVWQEQAVQDHIIEVLSAVADNGHHFGRPFITAYQLAIEIDRTYPELATALNVTVGGVGTGVRTSLAQYLAGELSRRISQDPAFPVEGAFLSSNDELEVRYQGPAGTEVVSSLTGTGWPLSMFRLR